jgi:uncharacterized protein
MSKFLSLIVKTGSSCNLACKYCDADIYSNQRISFEVLLWVIKRALDAARSVHFIWHGGEPLLLGKNFFKKIAYFQQNYVKEGQFINNSLQTNGYLLDEEWLKIFEEYSFSIGVSLDGPEELHNENRILRNGSGSHSKIMESISLMRGKNIPFGVLAVVTDDTLKIGAKRFFEFFMQNNIKNFALLCQRPAINVGHKDFVNRTDYSHFVNEIFDLWYYLDDPSIHIRDFESILSALVGGHHRVCLLEGNCIGKYFGINFNGDIFHCDEFMFDPVYKIGNVINDNFDDIALSNKIAMLKARNEDEIHKLQCKWLPICNGGCPKDRYVNRKLVDKGVVRCCGFSDLIEHIVKRISQDPKIAKLKIESFN